MVGRDGGIFGFVDRLVAQWRRAVEGERSAAAPTVSALSPPSRPRAPIVTRGAGARARLFPGDGGERSGASDQRPPTIPTPPGIDASGLFERDPAQPPMRDGRPDAEARERIRERLAPCDAIPGLWSAATAHVLDGDPLAEDRLSWDAFGPVRRRVFELEHSRRERRIDDWEARRRFENFLGDLSTPIALRFARIETLMKHTGRADAVAAARPYVDRAFSRFLDYGSTRVRSVNDLYWAAQARGLDPVRFATTLGARWSADSASDPLSGVADAGALWRRLRPTIVAAEDALAEMGVSPKLLAELCRHGLLEGAALDLTLRRAAVAAETGELRVRLLGTLEQAPALERAQAIRRLLATGSAKERAGAVSLIDALEGPAALPALRDRLASERAKRVRAAIEAAIAFRERESASLAAGDGAPETSAAPTATEGPSTSAESSETAAGSRTEAMGAPHPTAEDAPDALRILAIDGSMLVIPPEAPPPAPEPLTEEQIALLQAALERRVRDELERRTSRIEFARSVGLNEHHWPEDVAAQDVAPVALEAARRRLTDPDRQWSLAVWFDRMLPGRQGKHHAPGDRVGGHFAAFLETRLPLFAAARVVEHTRPEWIYAGSACAWADPLNRALFAHLEAGADIRTLVRLWEGIQTDQRGAARWALSGKAHGDPAFRPYPSHFYLLASHLPLVARALVSPRDVRHGRGPVVANDRALGFIEAWPGVPEALREPLMTIGLSAEKTRRRRAWALLSPAIGLDAALIKTLNGRSAAKRAAAAAWLAHRGGAAAVDALADRAAREREPFALREILEALLTLDADVQPLLSADRLVAMAAHGLGDGVPKELDGYRLDALPPARWREGGRVDGRILRWWAIWEGGRPDLSRRRLPHALLDRLAPEDAARLGTHVLDIGIDSALREG
ncbi:MAG: hypothetical protein AAFW46_16215, partial [Pseudomonadota bacterium]